MATPARRRASRQRVGGKGAEPETQSRSPERASAPAAPTSRWYIVGTPKKSEDPEPASASTTPASKCSSRTTDDPVPRAPNSPAHRPWTWKSGRASTRRSVGFHRQASRRDSTPAARLAWVRTAPLGDPVVPEVYTIKAG